MKRDISERWKQRAGESIITRRTEFINTDELKIHSQGCIIIKDGLEYARIPIKNIMSTETITVKGTYTIEPLAHTWVEVSPTFDNINIPLACGDRNNKMMAYTPLSGAFNAIARHNITYYEHHGLMSQSPVRSEDEFNFTQPIGFSGYYTAITLPYSLVITGSSPERTVGRVRYYVETTGKEVWNVFINCQVNGAPLSQWLHFAYANNQWVDFLFAVPMRNETNVDITISNMELVFNPSWDLTVAAVIAGWFHVGNRLEVSTEPLTT